MLQYTYIGGNMECSDRVTACIDTVDVLQKNSKQSRATIWECFQKKWQDLLYLQLSGKITK